jgi:hypothetical protein
MLIKYLPLQPLHRFLRGAEKKVFQKMRELSLELGSIMEVSQGLIPYNTKAMSQQNPYLSERKEGEEWKPLLDRGACIGRYSLSWNGIYVKYGDWLYTANKPKFYENPKILVQRHRNPGLARRVVATLDEQSFYYKDNLCGIIMGSCEYDMRFLLGVINSSLINAFYRKSFTEVSLNPTYLRRIPIRALSLKSKPDRTAHDQVVYLVSQMLSLHKQLQAARTEQDKTLLQRQIAATDKEIDRLVYDLYGLTDDEIAIVEGGS